MLRVLPILALALCATPALAQTCQITRKADGLTTIAQVTVKDTTIAKDLMLDTGPIRAAITFDPKAKGYSVKKGETASLFLFRTGKSVDGADWRSPGSIATEDAGFAFEWPHILLNGKPLTRIDVAFASGETGDGWSINQDKTRQRGGVALVDLTAVVKVPDHCFDTLFYGADEEEAFDIWYDWQAELRKRQPVTVTINDPTTKAVVATISFPQPAQDVMQARLADDVNALRKAFADNKCVAS